MNIAETILKVQNQLGLHARPAAQFVQTTNKFKSKIRVIKDDMEVDGKSIMGLLLMAAPFGSQIKIVAEGEDAQAAVDSLHTLFNNKFGEQ